MFSSAASLRVKSVNTFHRFTLAVLTIAAVFLLFANLRVDSAPPSACTTATFSHAPFYPVGSQPRHANVADLNLDGKPDIVTANYAVDSVSVLLNDGSGGFTGPTFFPAGAGSQSVAIADFNSDGKPDLVTANVNASDVSLLVGDGAGNFAAPVTFNAGGQAYFVASGDFNNDTKPDLAVATGQRVSILLGNGAGGFAAPRLTSNLRAYQFLATGDFNSDGKLDLAAAAGNGLKILSGNGVGDFAETSCTTVGASNIVVGDLNGDSKPDLVTTTTLNGEVSVLINNGAGCFTLSTFSAGPSPGFHSAASQIADLNHDGKMDLLIGTDFAGFSVFLGDGAGNFGPALVRANASQNLWGVTDLDGDGNRDAVAVTSTDSVAIYFGDGTGGFRNTLNGGGPIGASAAGDFNNDGRTDLILTSNRNIFILLNDGLGGFELPRVFSLGTFPSAIATGDFNNDNKLDVVAPALQSSVGILLGDGAGNLAAPIASDAGDSPGAFGIADFNNDGKLDVVTADSFFGKVSLKLGDGAGGLGSPMTFSTDVATNSTLFGIGDFNTDGKKDIAIPSFRGVSIFLGNGAGGFAPGNTVFSGTGSINVLAVDLNADGKLDLVSKNPDNDDITSALGDGAGNFGTPRTVVTSGRFSQIAAGEFNGDGRVDIAISGAPIQQPGNPGNSHAEVLLNDGTGGLQSPSAFIIPEPNSISVGDFTGDGRTDIVTTSIYGMFSKLVNMCSAATPQPATLQFSAPSYAVDEAAGSISIAVTRTGDTTAESSVDFETRDGSASQTSDYTIAAGTLRFAAGETSKSITILITDDLYAESQKSLGVALIHPSGATLGTPAVVTINILDNDPVFQNRNPLDDSDARFFVRQHYYDFLSRLPDQGGLDFWASQITQCGSDQLCRHNKKVEVSNAFFYEQEYQRTGSYVFYIYRAAFGNSQPFPNPDTSNLPESAKIPSYSAFVSDRARVIDSANLAQSQLDFANAFVQRPQFVSKYPNSLDAAGFVDAVITTIGNGSGIDLTSQRATLINLYNQGGRGTVLYRLANDIQSNPVNNRPFIDAEYNRAFVFTEYAGYLRRDSDIGGFLFWLDQINRSPVRDPNIQHVMVCAFITSQEYQKRFSSVAPHSNSECQ